MQSNCIRDASKACFNTCCTNPLLPPPPQTSPPATTPRRDFVSAILSTIPPNTNFTNHESLPSSNELLSTLTNAIPNYLNTVLADNIRAQEYYHFNLSNHVCLDYVGHGLFSYAQRHGGASTPPAEAPSTSAEAEPPPPPPPFFKFSHSSMSFTSYLLYGGKESEFEAAAKRRILKFMNLLEDDYSLIFTPNQSSAFKLLAHSYPFRSHPNLVTVYDYDNEALQLMIEAAGKHGGRTHSAVFSLPSLRLNSGKLRRTLVAKNKPRNRGLFAFPLQSRMTGARYSYQWMNLARENGWHVLLDASALADKEMETLGLSLFQPDFLISSFFEIFGENPSGFCCLFVKKSSISVLNQSSTNVGIINLVPIKNKIKNSATDHEADLETTPSSSSSSLREAQEFEERKKKEKAPSSEIVELDHHDQNDVVLDEVEFRGLDHADTLGLILISSRLRYLTNWVVNALLSLRHPHSGNGLITLYGPRIRLDRGPALAFNVHDWRGERVEPLLVQKLADRNNISLSIGFLRNICFSEANVGEDKERLMLQEKNMKKKKKKKKKRSKEECGVGVVSANLGMLSNFEDVYRFWAFVARFLDADFVEKEKWRYTALNQTTVEV